MTKHTILALAAAVVLAGCVAPTTMAGSSGGTSAPSAIGGVTMAAYTQLATGMTYEEVIAILGGPGEELSRSDIGDITTVMYMWKGAGSLGANMNAMFQGNKLVSKAQFGLK